MIASSHFQIIMVGLPQSGKTTFLAALWHVLEERTNTTLLRLKKLDGDRTYLNRICENWRSCSPLDRTTLQGEEYVTLCLESDEYAELNLTIPDLSGEVFELQVSERRWARKYDEMVQSLDGVLLFVHPDFRSGNRIDSANALETTLKVTQSEQSTSGEGYTDQASWMHEHMPTQVQLVELLQFIAERAERELRVSVIVSAWDLVASFGHSPSEFVEKRLPLLWQYLQSNQRINKYKVIGVSAQGGDISSERISLLGYESPLDRIKVVGIETKPYDVTSTISWLLADLRS